MTEQEIKKKCKSLDHSNETFKNIVENCNNPKFTNLDRWQNFQAQSFKEENTLKNNSKYKYYKRGTIVFVNFGTSIGSELSGHHFAIVLNRKDNPYSRTLTVLPLTSKNKKSNINLGNELIRGVFVETKKQIYKIISSILNIKQYTVYDDLSLEVTTSDNSILKNNDANYYIMNELSCLLTEGISNFTISKENDLEDLQNRLEQLLRITDYYSAKKEDSYAIVSSVTTISKLRINKPINDFDPIGKIRVSESVLKDIDRSIAKTILNLDNEIWQGQNCAVIFKWTLVAT